MQVLVAFPASERLYQNTRAFIDAVNADPEGNHQPLLHAVADDFISEVLAAFFDGPVQALRVKGSMAKLIDSIVGVINKAARALVKRVFSKVSTAEQRQLADHFDSIDWQFDGQPYCAFPLDPELANEAALMFQTFRDGNGDPRQMQKIMRALCDGAIEYYFDRSLGCVRTGAMTRGLVSTGRATIAKAAHSAVEKTLPGLAPAYRQPVLDYFEGMLISQPA